MTERNKDRESQRERKGRDTEKGVGGQKPSVHLPDHYIKDRVLEGDLRDPVQNSSLRYLALGL